MAILRVIDVEENYEYQLEVTEEEFKRAQLDLTFATKLLQDAKIRQKQECQIHVRDQLQECNLDLNDFTNPQPGPSQSNPSEETMNSANLENIAPNSFIWNGTATKLFINLYKDMADANIPLKSVWCKIATEMGKKGYIVSSKQCCTKLNTLKRAYKNIKDHNSKSGSDRQTWPYFDALDEIFSKQPWVTPCSTISSSNNDDIDTQAEHALSQENGSNPKKRKTEKLLEDILQTRKEQQLQRQMQHEEKMKRIDKMNELLEKLLNKQ